VIARRRRGLSGPGGTAPAPTGTFALRDPRLAMEGVLPAARRRVFLRVAVR
jgi:hypothetical protein